MAFFLGYFLFSRINLEFLANPFQVFLFFLRQRFLYNPLNFCLVRNSILRPIRYQPRLRLDTVFTILFLFTAASFFTLFGKPCIMLTLGEQIVAQTNPLFFRLFGKHIALFVTFFVTFYLTAKILRISIRELSIMLLRRLVEDFREWQTVRRDTRSKSP